MIFTRLIINSEEIHQTEKHNNAQDVFLQNKQAISILMVEKAIIHHESTLKRQPTKKAMYLILLQLLKKNRLNFPLTKRI